MHATIFTSRVSRQHAQISARIREYRKSTLRRRLRHDGADKGSFGREAQDRSEPFDIGNLKGCLSYRAPQSAIERFEDKTVRSIVGARHKGNKLLRALLPILCRCLARYGTWTFTVLVLNWLNRVDSESPTR
jgi:hypothetical protein